FPTRRSSDLGSIIRARAPLFLQGLNYFVKGSITRTRAQLFAQRLHYSPNRSIPKSLTSNKMQSAIKHLSIFLRYFRFPWNWFVQWNRIFPRFYEWHWRFGLPGVEPLFRQSSCGRRKLLHGEPNMRPSPRDNPPNIIAPAADSNPAPLAITLGDVSSNPRYFFINPHCSVQMGERVKIMRIRSILSQYDVRLEISCYFFNGRFVNRQKRLVLRESVNREIERSAVPFAISAFRDCARPGKKISSRLDRKSVV